MSGPTARPPEERRAIAATYMRQWRGKHPGYGYQSSYNRLLKTKYGIDIEMYKALLQKQGGVCAICGRPNANGFALAVDHDHRTGKVRALLCCQCNAAIGQLSEDVELMKKVIAYIEGVTA